MAKTQHVKEKAQKQAGTRVMHTVQGGPLTGYYILDPQGERVSDWVFENMWDAINARKRFDGG